MKHLGLFEGIGGFSLAARWMGWETVAWCEYDKKCQELLRLRFPEAKEHGNIKTTDFTEYANQIDIITGGFPCQPYSLAGARKGKEDDRHLWPEMLRAIGEIQPSWVVGENVFGLINWGGGLVFNEVQTDLEAKGYEVWAYVLPACAVNAPHRRDRVWFIAYSESNSRNNVIRNERQDTSPIQKERFNEYLTTSYPSSLQWTPARKEGFNSRQRGEALSNIKRVGSKGFAANSDHNGLQGSEIVGGINSSESRGEKFPPRCFPSTWEIFPTQSPICGRDDGVSNRVDRLKQLGNAIVPQVAFEIFKAIEQMNTLTEVNNK